MRRIQTLVQAIENAQTVGELLAAEAQLNAIELGVAPPGRLQVAAGRKIRLTVWIDYKGPIISATLYAALGQRGGVLGFVEYRYAQKTWSLPNSNDFVTHTTTIDIDTAGLSNEINLDVYCKLIEYPGAGQSEVDDVIDIIGVTFQNFKITDYSEI